MATEIEPSPGGGGGTGQVDPTPQDDTLVESHEGTVDYVGIGREFTGWFNGKLKLLPDASIRLGTKTGHVVELHPDGRLECEVEGEGSKNEQHFVAFEMAYFDQLQRRFTALGL